MNYEEKYKEALENLRKIKEENKDNNELVEFIECKFPELKESKAEWVEKIRKELKDYLGKRSLKKLSESDAVNQWIDWIEKQGKQKEINRVEMLKHYPRETELYSPLYGKLWLAEVDEENEIITCYKYPLNEGCTRAILEQEDTVSFYSNGTTGLPDFSVSKDCMLFLYAHEKQSEQSHWKPTEEQLQTLHAQLNEGAVTYPDDKRVLTTLYENLMKITTQEEKQVEQKETLCDKCRKEQPSHFGHDIISLGRWALKHQSKQESNRVEPKFGIGDWVVHYMSDGKKVIRQIIGITNKSYILDGEDFNTFYFNDLENDYHLWTIQDAKDGDVLRYVDGFKRDWVFIYNKCNGFDNNHINDDNYVINHYCLVRCDNFYPKGGIKIDIEYVNPATKEQCDLLFQKIKESGYEWDKEELELKKIEPNFKVEECKWYVCTKTFVLRDKIVVLKGQTYKSNQNGAIEGENKCLFIDTHDGKASDYFRPWTIEDAEDGDVLASHECYVIFKEIDGSNIKCYCTYHYMGFNPSFYVDTLQNKNAFYPSTKEQRDLLFQKMKESGYEWDADKKELKKIEPKHTWSEEDEKILNEFIESLRYCNGNGYNKQIDWLKSLKDRI